MSFLPWKQASATEHFVVTHFDAYQDGRLARTERAVYEQHRQSCQACREWLGRQDKLVARLEREMAPAAVLTPAAAARIQQDLYRAMRRAVIMNNVRASVAGAGALAVLLLAVGAILWWQSGGLPIDTRVPAPPQPPSAEESMPTEASVPSSVALAQELDDLFKAYQETGVFNGSVLVARGDEIILSEGYGLADAEQEIPNTPQTRYRIGGITEAFTAAAVLLLQDQGKLSVDDPICDYLDACPAAWEAVTIQHLLNHSSGIADYFYEGGQLGAEPTPDELLDRVIDLPLGFEPGSQYQGSRSGFVILGLIIERVAGRPYLSFLQEYIFDPLAMTGTGIEADNGELAVGYKFGTTKADDVDVSPYFASASLYSTVEDLYRFIQGLQTGQLLSQEAHDQMFATYFYPFSQYPDFGSSYGNWAGAIMDGGRAIFNSAGTMEGFQANLALYPDDDVTIILLENLENADPGITAREVAKRVLGDE